MSHADPLGAANVNGSGEAGFEVGVLFGSPLGTFNALKMAASVAADLDGRISLICVHSVPYPLERPPVSIDLLTERLRAVAEEAAVPVEIQLYFGRNVLETLEAVLHPDTILVIGSENHAWASRNRKLMKRLLKHGHSVVLAEQQKTSCQPFLGKVKAFRQLSSVSVPG